MSLPSGYGALASSAHARMDMDRGRLEALLARVFLQRFLQLRTSIVMTLTVVLGYTGVGVSRCEEKSRINGHAVAPRQVTYSTTSPEGRSRTIAPLAASCCMDPEYAHLCLVLGRRPGPLACITLGQRASPRDRVAERYSLLRKLTIVEGESETLCINFCASDKVYCVFPPCRICLSPSILVTLVDQ